MIAYIHAHKDRYGVEPIWRVLPIAPSTCYAAHHRPSSARAVRDAKLKGEIARVHAEHFGVYGAARCGGSCTARESRWRAAPWRG
jgi:putative transposase